MGWSQDPVKRARQEAALEAGRKIRDARRAAGLPSKVSERRRSDRVVDGTYDRPKPAGKPKPKGGGDGGKPPRAPARRRSPEPAGGGGERRAKRDWWATVGRVMGVD